jgi:hypothetical protein
MVSNWLRLPLHRQLIPESRPGSRARVRLARLHLEVLEDRTLPSTVGVYDLQDPNQLSIAPAILGNPNVDGIALRSFWNHLEPAHGVYDWTVLDQPLAQSTAAGKSVSLSVTAGIQTPAWVYAEGAAPFPYTDSSGASQVIPIPWDPVYLADWKEFVQAAGERYASNPAVVQVKLTGLNRETQEVLLPKGAADLPHWQSVGYTSTKVYDAWVGIVDTFAHAFPNQQLAIIIVPNGLPDIDNRGQVVSGAGEDLVRTLINDGIARYGAPQFVVQNSGLSDFYVSSEVVAAASQVDTGYQMLWVVTGDPLYRMSGGIPMDPATVLQIADDNGIAAGARYLEIYRQDIANPDLYAVVASAHDQLTHSLSGLPGAPVLALPAVSDSDVQLTWTPRPANADGFTVQRSDHGPDNFRVIATVTSPGFRDPNLPPGNYYYRVQAFNSQGTSPYSNSANTVIGPTSPFTDHSDGFADTADLRLNNGTAVAGTRLRLTDGGSNEARTAWTTGKVPVLSFSTSFLLQDQSVQGSADGVTFAIQNNDAAQVGLFGGGLGYQGIGHSVAVMFDLYSGGSHESTTKVLINGSADMTGAIDMGAFGVVLGGNHPLRIDLEYDGTQLTLSETVTDTVNGNTFQHIYTGLNIPQIVGGTTAYVGFTGATGGETSIQDILAWSGRFLDPVQPVSHVSLSAANGITGTPLALTVAARDVFNNIKSDYRGTVHFTSSDPQATLPDDYTFSDADNGDHVFTDLILRTAGTQLISAQDTALAYLSGSTAVDITAGATQLEISYPAEVTAGSLRLFTITAQDAFGNIATTYRGTVHLSSSDGQALLSPDATFTADDNGTHLFAAVFFAAGPQMLTATDTHSGAIVGTETITVDPAAASRLAVSGFPSPTPAGAIEHLTVTAVDPYGNVATGYMGTVTFSSSDSQGLLQSAYPFTAADAGRHQFAAVLLTAGTQSITVTDTVGNLSGTQNGIVVTAGPAVSFLVEAPTNIPAGTPFILTIVAVDRFGNVVTDYDGTVSLSTSDPDAGVFLPANYTFQPSDDGVVRLAVILHTGGEQTITVTDTADDLLTGTLTVTIV